MESSADGKGYPVLFFHTTAKWRTGLLVTFLVIGISSGFFFWYSSTSNDASPDSIAGYGYAILGTAFLLLAALRYTIRRLSHNKRTLGQLNSALHWHIFFAIIGLALLLMHSFGNFNPRSGTYALYGLLALVVSGAIGRALDHIIPRLIAREVQKALTARGEDRIETISQQLQAIVVHNSETRNRRYVQFSRLQSSQTEDSPTTSIDFEERPLHAPWDLAYISLEATPQELGRVIGQYRPLADKSVDGGIGAINRPLQELQTALLPGAEAHISALQRVQRAMQREQFYRYIIRYWRLFHISLALLTLGLITWHLIYAAQLLLH